MISAFPAHLRDHLHSQTLYLMAAWCEFRSRGGYGRGTLCPRGMPREDGWKVEEMGWAYLLGLKEWKQEIIWSYFTTGKEAWEEMARRLGLSKRKLRGILLELQDGARIRGLLEDEDTELILSAAEVT